MEKFFIVLNVNQRNGGGLTRHTTRKAAEDAATGYTIQSNSAHIVLESVSLVSPKVTPVVITTIFDSGTRDE